MLLAAPPAPAALAGTPARSGFTRSLKAYLRGLLALVAVVAVGLSAARADYIAEVRDQESSGYLYICEKAVKRHGLNGWLTGDVIIRDDKRMMYFVSWAKQRREDAENRTVNIDEELRKVKEDLAEGRDAARARWLAEVQATAPTFDVYVVSYADMDRRVKEIHDRLKPIRDESYRMARDPNRGPLERRGFLEYVATFDAYFNDEPEWTNTGETKVIAGKQCMKYEIKLPPVTSLNVWMTTELGSGYTAGRTFARSFYMNKGGVRALEVLAEIPGFPMKIEGRHRNITGRGMGLVQFEVKSLLETDLDEREFEPPARARTFEGELPF